MSFSVIPIYHLFIQGGAYTAGRANSKGTKIWVYSKERDLLPPYVSRMDYRPPLYSAL